MKKFPKQTVFKRKKNQPQVYTSNWLSREKVGSKHRAEKSIAEDDVDSKFGVSNISDFKTKNGWLFNYSTTAIIDKETNIEKSALKLYFIDDLGGMFSINYVSKPYFYLKMKKSDLEFETAFKNKFSGLISKVEKVEKIDLDQKNHLCGVNQKLIKLIFENQRYLEHVKERILKIIRSQRSFNLLNDSYDYNNMSFGNLIQEIREHDLPYQQRVCIDKGLRVGKWYEIVKNDKKLCFTETPLKLNRPPLKTFTFDIETSKSPMRFPDADVDFIMMISIMINGEGFLIINRSIVSEDIADFEYAPKKKYKGHFKVFNEQNEIGLLQRFFELVKTTNPNIFVTYNGDSFDWPFIETRSKINGFDLEKETGVRRYKSEFLSRFALHLDAFCWVKRDSYLPIGSQGLKAVTRAKLGYEPEEVDPEKMVEFAQTRPQTLAVYSVSDAVATHFLYHHYVHSFIFSLCTIVPLAANQVMRKGTGTLCEALLLVEAASRNILSPNKQVEPFEKFHNGKPLESETYVGGHVECIESGIFRDDIPMRFRIEKGIIEEFSAEIDKTVNFAVENEFGRKIEDIANLNDLKAEIKAKLDNLSLKEVITDFPKIYHFDVVSMYPNIILSNRLQPVSIVTKADCASCDFNLPENRCKRKMKWKWRGKVFPSQRGEYEHIKAQLEVEELPEIFKKKGYSRFADLKREDKKKRITRRLKEYCRKVYKKISVVEEEIREDTVCQRENPFYVDTVRSFRDRRYRYKTESKEWRRKETSAPENSQERKKASEMAVVFDSMQLAHKCILNSFYGYVMRRSSRWYSMPMAAITTMVGAEIIKSAHKLLERFARPLELDTDGVWCCLPAGFPTDFRLVDRNGKEKMFSFLCSALNVRIQAMFNNPIYQTLIDEKSQTYKIEKKCSILFEMDGPYRCMMLPASPEEGKTLKKRYAVYNKNGSLAELKGFEIKRRGELKILKIFQKQVFKSFLRGSSLEEVYENAAIISNYWLDIIYREGVDLTDIEIFDLLAESKNMSRNISDYEKDRSTSITCALRVGEFLGDKMIKGEGLSLKFLISRMPPNKTVSDRAIPVVIFQAEEKVKKHFLKRWCNEPNLQNFDVRNIMDWEYYKQRFGKCVRKIVTLPAAMQNINNPVQRLPHPAWLLKQKSKIEPFNQPQINKFFKFSEGKKEENFKQKNIDKASNKIDDKKPDKKMGQIGNSKNDDKAEINKNVKKGKKRARIDQNFLKWNKESKKAWDALMKGRKRRKFETTVCSVKDYLNIKNSEIIENELQIVQICQTEFIGKFWVWIFSSNKTLRKIELDVPQKFLLNRYEPLKNNEFLHLKLEKTQIMCQKSPKMLPRPKKVKNLYEITMPTITFNENLNSVRKEQNAILSEGIYEAFSPPEFKAISYLGCFSKIVNRPKKIDKNSGNGENYQNLTKNNFCLDDFQKNFLIGASSNYLESAEYCLTFLYHSRYKNRGIYAFYVCGAEIVTAEILIVNPFKKSEMDAINIDKIAPKILANFLKNKQLKVTKAAVKTFSAAEKQLKKSILSLTNSATFLIIQSPQKIPSDTNQNEEKIDKTIGIGVKNGEKVKNNENFAEKTENLRLFNDFKDIKEKYPMFNITFHMNDCNLSAFNWERHLVLTALKRFDVLHKWWNYKINFSRYAKIPIGNFESDNIILILDVMYARLLESNKVALWASCTKKPDFGGFEEDQVVLKETKSSPRVINSGCYRTFCVEMDISILAVCAILESDRVENEEIDRSLSRRLENTERNKKSNNNCKGFRKLFRSEETNSCRTQFRVLKLLVNNLFHDVAVKNSKFADLILANFYRWLCNKSSFLYDPSLHYYVYLIMKKYHQILLAELKKIGAKIIFSSFSKITIDTGRIDYMTAKQYVDYLIETIRSKSMFDLLGLNPTRFWRSFIFLDQDNFAGIDSEEGENAKLTSSWNFCGYLPSQAEKCFQIILAWFILKPFNEILKNGAKLNKKERKEFLSRYVKNLVVNQITKYLFTIIPELVRTLSNSLDDPKPFAAQLRNNKNLAQSQAYNPTLNLVIYICRVLSLEKSVEEEALNLKQNLLKLVGSTQFAPEAQFAEPSLSFILEGAICNYCNFCCDLDLCRNSELLAKNWVCSVCKNAYDMDTIERKLIDSFQADFLAFFCQDQYCSKCKSIKSHSMKSTCRCSGRYNILTSENSHLNRLSLYLKIAEFYNFKILAYSAAEILRLETFE